MKMMCHIIRLSILYILFIIIIISINTHVSCLYLNESVFSLQNSEKLFALNQSQWQSEDRFCDQLSDLNVHLCQCVFDETNRLSLLCGGVREHNWLVQLNQTFALLNNVTHTNVSLEEIVLFDLASLTYLNAAWLPNNSVFAFRIFDCPKLTRLDFIEHIPNKFLKSLRTLEVANTSLGETLFEFTRYFPRLQTLMLSDLKINKLSANILAPADVCLPLRRFSLNHRCSNTSKPFTIEPRALSSLCHVRMLDLSCLGLIHLEPNSLYLSPPPPNSHKSNSTRILWLDLSHNQLSNVSNVFVDLIAMQNWIDSIMLNLNHNPIERFDKSLVYQFIHHHDSSNGLQVWQGPNESVLDCADCTAKWMSQVMQSQHCRFESYCKKNNDTSSSAMRLTDNKTFQHCN